jgi:hypothetical protein
MKLSPDAVIAYEKVRDYLLEWRAENDKSLFLARAGYTKKDFERLADDIREQLLSLDANYEESTEYGQMFSITGWIPQRNALESREYLDD